MPTFKQRSYTKELLDGDDIPFAHIAQNMRELNVINHRLGGHRITLKGMQTILKGMGNISDQPITVVEIGCGGGDNLRVVQQWAARNQVGVQLTGIDINEECIAFANNQPQNKGIHFICSDYRDVQFSTKPHLIFSSLFRHHFTNDDLVRLLQWMQQQASLGSFINDLHRHPLAFYSIRLLTGLFSKSYLVKNDAPLSVLRGFVKEDWQQLLQSAGIYNYNCRWQWAFRWLVTSVHAKGKSNI